MKRAKIYKPDIDETYSLVNNGTGVVEAEINNGCSIKVNPEDDVYVCGDLCLGGGGLEIMEKNKELIECLNGHIHVILGNHDTPARI